VLFPQHDTKLLLLLMFAATFALAGWLKIMGGRYDSSGRRHESSYRESRNDVSKHSGRAQHLFLGGGIGRKASIDSASAKFAAKSLSSNVLSSTFRRVSSMRS
jgi:hypothetical protein